MKAETWQPLQGKALWVNRLTLVCDSQLSLLIDCKVNDSSWELRFTNISGFNMTDVCFPAVIAGFEIIDNADRGWDGFARYRIHDFENDAISFYCQDISVYAR